MPNKELSKILDIMKPQRNIGLAGRRKQVEEKLKDINPAELPNRIGLIFDDSGSMSGEPLANAKLAVQNFTNNCNKMETSLCLYPMNGVPRSLTIDYTSLNVLVMGINDHDLRGTPLYTVLKKLLDNEDINRGVIFSDGSPTDSNYVWQGGTIDTPNTTVKEMSIHSAKQKQIPIDTIYIGPKEDSYSHTTAKGYTEMQWIAEQTGGIFIHFEDSQSLSKNLKYLSPALRPLLMNAELKDKIQKGEQI